jgi:hypothetical protein
VRLWLGLRLSGYRTELRQNKEDIRQDKEEQEEEQEAQMMLYRTFTGFSWARGVVLHIGQNNGTVAQAWWRDML